MTLHTSPDSDEVLVLMLKPDVWSMPCFCSKTASEILMILQDIVVGKTARRFYADDYYFGLARNLLHTPQNSVRIDPELAVRIVLRLELLRYKSLLSEWCRLEMFIRDCLDALCYKVVREVVCQLTEDSIRQLYPVLSRPDRQFGEKWKSHVIRALEEGPVLFLFLRGELDISTLKNFKDVMRRAIRKWPSGSENFAKNCLHVPEKEEIPMTLEISNKYREKAH